MSDQSNLGIFDITKPVVLLFPTIDKPRAFGPKGKERGEPKFSAGFGLKIGNGPDDPDGQLLRDLKSKAAAVARAKWPGVDFKTLAFPWELGDRRADDAKAKGKDQEFERGLVILTARSKFRPRLAGLENGKLVDYDNDDATVARIKPKFYFGTDCFAQVNLVAYDPVGSNGKPGVAAYLNQLVTLNRGKKLAGGQSAAETFKEYAGSVSDYDPTGGDNSGIDDDIPF
jgi:hypothetical protein